MFKGKCIVVLEVREEWSPFWHLVYDYVMPLFPKGCFYVELFKIKNLRLNSKCLLCMGWAWGFRWYSLKQKANSMFIVNNWYIFLSKNNYVISPAGWFNINIKMQKQFIKQIGNHQLHYCNRANTVSWFSINGTIYRMPSHLLSVTIFC